MALERMTRELVQWLARKVFNEEIATAFVGKCTIICGDWDAGTTVYINCGSWD